MLGRLVASDLRDALTMGGELAHLTAFTLHAGGRMHVTLDPDTLGSIEYYQLALKGDVRAGRRLGQHPKVTDMATVVAVFVENAERTSVLILVQETFSRNTSNSEHSASIRCFNLPPT